ncbi:putative inorganic phosphate transporter 1-4 [Panicum miliaceum]|uniref:Inorganic phosphate transporter 1-4 n=1 Tax=Panicum miliaceum TaxID=4540 RepID=A0A3L6Q777_PANMI|nr:putative inorganic phosphate transporter 1-4 [Panicum miliaceum]
MTRTGESASTWPGRRHSCACTSLIYHLNGIGNAMFYRILNVVTSATYETRRVRKQITVLHALDVAKTQLYHFTTIVIAGMGFFTDAYDLFSISLITDLLGRIYYDGKLPTNAAIAVNGIAFVGTVLGQIFFGWLRDRMGRKHIYGITLKLMGLWNLAAGTVVLIISARFKNSPGYTTDRFGQADYVWRIVLMFGAVPAVLAYYWRMKMPETARYTALIAKNLK